MQSHRWIKSRIRLTPAPTTSHEVRYIYECFKKLGAVGSFHIDGGSPGLNKYGNNLTVMISIEQNDLDPFNSDNNGPGGSTKVLAGTKRAAKVYLDRILALPRLQYVEKYPKFWIGDRSISFRYSLKGKASKHQGNVTVSESKSSNPFCVLETEDLRVIDEIKQGIRFNFQKFTKIDIIKGHQLEKKGSLRDSKGGGLREETTV